MNDLFPFLRLYRLCVPQIMLGILLSLIALLASMSLLALSGWFLSASALAGLTMITARTFNFFTPGAGVRGFSITRTVSRYFERVVNHDTTFRLLARIRVNCYTKLEPLTPVVLQDYRDADLLNRFVTDTEMLDHLYLRLIIPFISTTLSCLVVVLFVLFFSGKIAMTLALIFLISIIILPFVVYRAGYYPGEKISDYTKQLRTSILDYIGGYTDLVINGAAPVYKSLIMRKEKELYDQEALMASLSGSSAAMVTLVGGITLLVTIYLGSIMVSTGVVTGPVAGMLILIALGIFEAIMPLPQSMQVLGKIRRSASRINGLLQHKTTIDFPEEITIQQSKLPKAIAIDLVKLNYNYPGESVAVLNNLTLNISPGEKIAITGHTGCGKSTLLNLLTRSDNPVSGKIQINQQDIHTFTEKTLRQSMAVMPQRIHIFSGTLKDNLLLANPHVDDDELNTLLTKLDLQHLAEGEKKGVNTWLGEGGRVLSGGEIRRIGIARVLLQNSPLVLLDEPSEGLDIITEEKIIKAVMHYCSERTLLVVTHKPAILRYMDRVCPWESLQPQSEKI